MAELDYYIKRLLQDRTRFADLYNAEVFHGRQVLNAEDLTPVDNESGIEVCTAIDELIEDGKVEGKVEGKNRMADLAAALLLENRTDLLAAAVKDKQLRTQLFEQYRL